MGVEWVCFGHGHFVPEILQKKLAPMNCMHWNVAPNALPGSARLVHVLDRWLNNCSPSCMPIA